MACCVGLLTACGGEPPPSNSTAVAKDPAVATPEGSVRWEAQGARLALVSVSLAPRPTLEAECLPGQRVHIRAFAFERAWHEPRPVGAELLLTGGGVTLSGPATWQVTGDSSYPHAVVTASPERFAMLLGGRTVRLEVADQRLAVATPSGDLVKTVASACRRQGRTEGERALERSSGTR